MRFLRKIIVKIKSQIVKFQLRTAKEDILQGSPRSGLSKEIVLQKIKEVPFWWHRIEVGYGLVTPGHHGDIHHPTGDKNLLENMQLPADISGKSVLDIGAWDGFYSFEAEKRGADRILAIDNFYRDRLEHTGSQGFEVAKEILNSKVEFKKASVYDLNPQDFGLFDIVFFFGVFYHLKHPLLALEKVYSVCQDLLVLETHYEPYWDGKTPLGVFYEKGEINNDPTTFWGFNETALLSMLRFVGFKKVGVVYRYADRIIIKAYKLAAQTL